MKPKKWAKMPNELVGEFFVRLARPFMVLAVAGLLAQAGQPKRLAQPKAVLPAIEGTRPYRKPKRRKAFGAMVGSDKWWLRSYIIRYLAKEQFDRPHDYVSISEIVDVHDYCYKERGIGRFEREANRLAEAGFLTSVGGGVYRVTSKGLRHHRRERRAAKEYRDTFVASISSLEPEAAGS